MKRCKKCGGYSEQPPVYKTDASGEYISRRCSKCGYTTREPTADAKEPRPTLADLVGRR